MGKGIQTLRPGIVIGAALFAVGLFFFFRWVTLSSEAESFSENAKKTIAYVSEIDNYGTGRRRHRRYERRVYVSYTVDGQHYEELLKGSTKDMQEHDVFNVQYDPDNPCDVRTIGYTGGSEQYSAFSAMCIVSGAVVAVVSGVTDRKRNTVSALSAEQDMISDKE